MPYLRIPVEEKAIFQDLISLGSVKANGARGRRVGRSEGV